MGLIAVLPAATGKSGASMLTKLLAIAAYTVTICFFVATICYWVMWGVAAKQQTEIRKVPQTEKMCNRDRFPNVDGANQSWAKCK